MLNISDMAADIIDATGKRINTATTADFLMPVVELVPNDGIEKKDKTIDGWLDMIPRVSITNEETGRVARLDNSERGMNNLIVRDNYGIFRQRGEREVRLNFNYDDCKRQTPRYLISRTKDGVEVRSRYFVILTCMLYPEIAKHYIRHYTLEANHLAIDHTGLQNLEYSSVLYEVCESSRNKRHGKYIRDWSLQKTPVSSFDFSRLTSLFTQAGAGNTDNLQQYAPDITTLEDVLAHPTEYAVSWRRLYAWVYFIKHHTTGDAIIWEKFRTFYNTEFIPTHFGSTEELKNKVLDLVKVM